MINHSITEIDVKWYFINFVVSTVIIITFTMVLSDASNCKKMLSVPYIYIYTNIVKPQTTV